MRKRKSTCGLCKPTKKWKKRDTRKTNVLKRSLTDEINADIKARVLHK